MVEDDDPTYEELQKEHYQQLVKAGVTPIQARIASTITAGEQVWGGTRPRFLNEFLCHVARRN